MALIGFPDGSRVGSTLLVVGQTIGLLSPTSPWHLIGFSDGSRVGSTVLVVSQTIGVLSHVTQYSNGLADN